MARHFENCERLRPHEPVCWKTSGHCSCANLQANRTGCARVPFKFFAPQTITRPFSKRRFANSACCATLLRGFALGVADSRSLEAAGVDELAGEHHSVSYGAVPTSKVSSLKLCPKSPMLKHTRRAEVIRQESFVAGASKISSTTAAQRTKPQEITQAMIQQLEQTRFNTLPSRPDSRATSPRNAKSTVSEKSSMARFWVCGWGRFCKNMVA